MKYKKIEYKTGKDEQGVFYYEIPEKGIKQFQKPYKQGNEKFNNEEEAILMAKKHIDIIELEDTANAQIIPIVQDMEEKRKIIIDSL